jgi:hypothetical protein
MNKQNVIDLIGGSSPTQIQKEHIAEGYYDFVLVFLEQEKYIEYEGEKLIINEILSEETYINDGNDEYLRREQQNEPVFTTIKVDCWVVDDSLSKYNPYMYRTSRYLSVFKGYYLDLKTPEHLIGDEQASFKKSHVDLEFPTIRPMIIDKFEKWSPMYSEEDDTLELDDEND